MSMYKNLILKYRKRKQSHATLIVEPKDGKIKGFTGKEALYFTQSLALVLKILISTKKKN